ncbi:MULTISPECIES: hypothetical protein [Microtetraspora]|uniref:Nuclear transport factor 2 family protein n=1 Tax=Microtetraspora glauca TaxID=1996 RepID=A0ABV3GH40_MICGL|nr:hypothetical protein [Microtetraspora sp. AC03309]MCC5578318.1 hypothetical protein [Microtetraspora sp. AC03309]
MDDRNLNDRKFVMVSSTASAVDPDGPTEFVYKEEDGIIWGDYVGDTVVHGHFVGTREADRIELTYIHQLKSGGRAGGRSASRIETLPDGRLHLIEEFQFEGDDTKHVSVCAEVS